MKGTENESRSSLVGVIDGGVRVFRFGTNGLIRLYHSTPQTS